LAQNPVIQHCDTLAKKGKFPVLLDQILENEIDRSASRVQRENYATLIEGLRALGANLLIPLYGSGRVLGFVALWVPTPPEPWGNNWGLLPIIYPFFEQAAQTMQNMQIYVRQREKERLAALGEMAAGLAHEIRNPLGAIKGAAQFLDPSADRPESRFLKVIIDEVDRLNRVVTQFLDYSKPPTTDFKTVDLSKLADKTVELLRPSIPNGIEFEFQASRIPALVSASAEQLQQVLINLIQNAQRALENMTPGMIRVTVGVEGEFPNSEVVLVVEDTGKGIKKENLEKIFIPFFTTSPSGTGLGLSISQKIVEAHRGRMEVLSEEGRFTKVSVILPYAKE
jgi:signal transduction histidine kinase